MPNKKNNETTTKFKVDISELKSGITEANRQIRLANAEFKSVASSMSDWADNADGVSAKLTQLDTVLANENKKLDALKRQLQLTAKEYGENSAEADELRIKIANQQVSIICPQPNFISKSENKVKNADVKDAFYFPFNTELSAGTANEMLEITGLERAVINFNYFLAEPETIYVTPSPDNPVEISGLGEMSGSGYFAFLNFETAGRITNIKIPLDGKMTNANLVHGGADLIDENNYIVNKIYTDTDNTLYMDSDNNVLYE